MNSPNIMESPNDEITLKELLLKAKEWFAYLISKWKTIVLSAFIGAALGASYSLYKKPIYTAKLPRPPPEDLFSSRA